MREFQLFINNEHLYNAVMAHAKEIGYSSLPYYDKEKIYIQFWHNGALTHSNNFFKGWNPDRFNMLSLEEFFKINPKFEITIDLTISEKDLSFSKEKNCLSCDTINQVLKALNNHDSN